MKGATDIVSGGNGKVGQMGDRFGPKTRKIVSVETAGSLMCMHLARDDTGES